MPLVTHRTMRTNSTYLGFDTVELISRANGYRLVDINLRPTFQPDLVAVSRTVRNYNSRSKQRFIVL